MVTKTVQVTFEVEVTVDEDKFDDYFMAEYADFFYPFTCLDEHMEHIAQMRVRNILEEFTEGYGEIKDLGIVANVKNQDEEILP